MALLIAPTEPARLHAMGRISSQPERYGCDVLWYARGKRWGVQRKEVKDLVASLEDGRLTRGRAMMRRCDQTVLIVEGVMSWTADGLLVGGKGTGGYGRDYSFGEIMGQVLSLANDGVWIWWTKDLGETAMAIAGVERWSQKETHQSLRGREPLVSSWGRPLSREYAIYMLTGLPGVGVELAGRVFDRFGRLPWRWDVTEDELASVPGIGKKKIAGMTRALSIRDEDVIV